MKCPFSKWGKKCISVCPSFLSPFFLTVRFCFLSSFFLGFSFLLLVGWLVGCLFLSWFGCFLFFLPFFIHTCLSVYRSLLSSTHIYTYTYAYILSVYSAESIFPSFSFLNKVCCTNVQPKVNPCPRHQCENTHLCSSLHVEELMCGRIERETGSQGKKKYNFVVRTPREDGERVTVGE